MGPKVMVTTEDLLEEGAPDSGDEQPDDPEAVDPDNLDFSQYRPLMVTSHEEVQDDDNKGNVSGLAINSSAMIQVTIGEHNLGVVEASVANTADYDLILGYSELRRLKLTICWDTGQLEFEAQGQEGDKEGTGKAWKQLPGEAGTGGINTKSTEPARVMGLLPNSAKRTVTRELEEFTKETGLSLNSVKPIKASPSGKKPKHPTVHGNEFVSAECLIQAALEDGPIGFMLLDTPPLLLPAFGFVPTGADRGVEMEVKVDKKVLAEDIPVLYQPLQDVFDEVEADKLPHHTKHDLHLKLMEGSRPLQGPLYLKGPKEMAELRKYLDENLAKRFIQPSKSPARSPVLFVPKKDGGLQLCVDYRSQN
ncbi:related to retrotransposon nucleocapsid protein [Ustilago bromivora]|uniref:Related to retrotransposon nucleocapsid protein n=1 Tax=Ustilago bromivora TaxID=307758 RepID=A0A1K0GHD7_9BASI|nr:related to retrotransposon nucleocapsid protein [Ustilago bromivora]